MILTLYAAIYNFTILFGGDICKRVPFRPPCVTGFHRTTNPFFASEMGDSAVLVDFSAESRYTNIMGGGASGIQGADQEF